MGIKWAAHDCVTRKNNQTIPPRKRPTRGNPVMDKGNSLVSFPGMGTTVRVLKAVIIGATGNSNKINLFLSFVRPNVFVGHKIPKSKYQIRPKLPNPKNRAMVKPKSVFWRLKFVICHFPIAPDTPHVMRQQITN
jgi:hypothetical protein